MKEVEMPSTYRIIDKKSRAKYTKYVTVSAGYIGDMEREFPIEDYYDYHCKRYDTAKKNHIQALEAALAAEEEAARAEARAKERKEAEAVDNYERVPLLIKYGLAPTDGWDTILYAILEQDPLLELADAMMMARRDFSHGEAVEGYLTDEIPFSIRTAVKKACEAWRECGDGRVFRDLAWNYDAIFESVGKEKPELVADYNKVSSRVGYY